VERPTDIKRTIDFMLGAWSDSPRIDPRHIGFFGFPRGGYTGLVEIGAELGVAWRTPCRNDFSGKFCKTGKFVQFRAYSECYCALADRSYSIRGGNGG
jgi:predicted dienelactone hydrolase